MNTYRPQYRPAGFATLPHGVTWEYVEAPSMFGLCNRTDIPQSTYRFGVIKTDRPLTVEELKTFELTAV